MTKRTAAHITIDQLKSQQFTRRRNRSNTGKAFERLIIDRCRLYEKQGIAVIEKVEPPTLTKGSGANRKTVSLRNPFLDFMGIITGEYGSDDFPKINDPTPIMFECKSTSKPALHIGGNSGLNHTQFESMKRWDRAGVDVFLLWECRGKVKRFAFYYLHGKDDLYVHFDDPCGYPIENMDFLKGK